MATHGPPVCAERGGGFLTDGLSAQIFGVFCGAKSLLIYFFLFIRLFLILFFRDKFKSPRHVPLLFGLGNMAGGRISNRMPHEERIEEALATIDAFASVGV